MPFTFEAAVSLFTRLVPSRWPLLALLVAALAAPATAQTATDSSAPDETEAQASAEAEAEGAETPVAEPESGDWRGRRRRGRWL